MYLNLQFPVFRIPKLYFSDQALLQYTRICRYSAKWRNFITCEP